MSRYQRIQDCMLARFETTYLLIEDESHHHGSGSGVETHFKIILVSGVFEPLTRIERHRLMHDVLADELIHGLHALSLSLYTPKEWETAILSQSPLCGHRN